MPKDLKAFIGCLNDLEFELMSCPDNTIYVKDLDRCEFKSNFVCNENPCKSGGICISDSKNTFHCECKKGFTGKTCDKEVDACFSNPCESFGETEIVEATIAKFQQLVLCEWLIPHIDIGYFTSEISN